MAEEEKAPEEAAETLPEESQARQGRRGRKVDPPVSLFPLSFEEAVDGLLSVKQEPSRRKPAPED